jgi:hypothetical protein
MNSRTAAITNPFRPGAGHPPPYLAGREDERLEFTRTLRQEPVLSNLVLTGLRGVGKTVLLETFRPIAIEAGWRWAGNDLSESASVGEEQLALRLITDLGACLQDVVISDQEAHRIGFHASVERRVVRCDFALLRAVFDHTPGLPSDKLKAVLDLAHASLSKTKSRGIVFAYDEAQNLGDRAEAHQYPLSMLLEVFQSAQRKESPFLLVLTGLPTLFPKLVEARTFAERMFHVMTLGRLTDAESRDAILKPIEKVRAAVKFTETGVKEIVEHSAGYPYFIQYLCREMFDAYLQQRAGGRERPIVTTSETLRKLDSDFFAGRWHRATDRQRDLLGLVADLPTSDDEFTVQEIVEQSKRTARPFTASHVSQILSKLAENGLVYKNRHGRYAFAVPLLGDFIRRRKREGSL